jgi:hypothetical protein
MKKILSLHTYSVTETSGEIHSIDITSIPEAAALIRIS